MAPTMRYVEARPELERFYADVVGSAQQNGLSDAELAAILALICGRMFGAAPVGVDKDTIRDTIIFNLKQGGVEAPGLLDALKGN